MTEHTIIVLVRNSLPVKTRKAHKPPKPSRGGFPWKGLAGVILALAALAGATATLVPQLKGQTATRAAVTAPSK